MKERVYIGSFAEVRQGKFVYQGFLLFLDQQGSHEYNGLTKYQTHTTFPSTPSAQQRARVKRKNVCKSNGVTRWRETWVSTFLRHEHFRAKYRYVGVFFERRFQPLSVGRFLKPMAIDKSVPQAPISAKNSKTQNRQNGPNFKPHLNYHQT